MEATPANRENTISSIKEIPLRYQSAKLSDFNFGKESTLINWIETRDNIDKTFIFIHGAPGTGKTHLAAAITSFIRSTGKNCGFVKAPEIFLQLRGSFQDGSKHDESYFIELYRKRIVGVFDDVGAHNLTDYALASWYNILDYRYSECIPSVFTSNLSIDSISKLMGDRIASRLASGIVLKLEGGDKRINRK